MHFMLQCDISFPDMTDALILIQSSMNRQFDDIKYSSGSWLEDIYLTDQHAMILKLHPVLV